MFCFFMFFLPVRILAFLVKVSLHTIALCQHNLCHNDIVNPYTPKRVILARSKA